MAYMTLQSRRQNLPMIVRLMGKLVSTFGIILFRSPLNFKLTQGISDSALRGQRPCINIYLAYSSIGTPTQRHSDSSIYPGMDFARHNRTTASY